MKKACPQLVKTMPINGGVNRSSNLFNLLAHTQTHILALGVGGLKVFDDKEDHS